MATDFVRSPTGQYTGRALSSHDPRRLMLRSSYSPLACLVDLSPEHRPGEHCGSAPWQAMCQGNQRLASGDDPMLAVIGGPTQLEGVGIACAKFGNEFGSDTQRVITCFECIDNIPALGVPQRKKSAIVDVLLIVCHEKDTSYVAQKKVRIGPQRPVPNCSCSPCGTIRCGRWNDDLGDIRTEPGTPTTMCLRRFQ